MGIFILNITADISYILLDRNIIPLFISKTSLVCGMIFSSISASENCLKH